MAEVIASTHAIPAFYNDKAAIATLCNQGVSLAHARDYAIIGCVELASAGRSYDASSSIMLNLPAIVELTLFNGKRPSISGNNLVGPQTGDPSGARTRQSNSTAISAGYTAPFNHHPCSPRFFAVHSMQAKT